MAARKPARRRRPPIKAARGDDLGVLVGTLVGRLNEHIDSVDADRQRLDEDRDNAATYRKEMRSAMDDLKTTVTATASAIEPIHTRLKTAEAGVKDWLTLRERFTGVRLAIVGAVSAFGFLFGGDIKDAVRHILRV